MAWSLCCLGLGNLTLSSAFLYALLLLLTWLAYKAIEPLWSPLRKLPGMPYNPLVGNVRFLMEGESMEAAIKMIKQFGPILRFYFMLGRERLLVASPEFMKHIFVTNANNYVKPPDRFRILEIVLGKGLLLTEGQAHAVHKRLMSPAFTSQSIAKMVPIFESRVKILAETWSKSVSKSDGSALIPIHSDLQRTTLDIIGLTAFGYDFNSLSDPDHPVSTSFHAIMSGFGLSWRTALPYYTYLPVPEMRKIWKCIDVMNDVVNGIISDKRKLINQGDDPDRVTGDVLGKMMLARDPETGQTLTDKELRDQIMTLMLAGHETTAVAMAWCLLMLATHQRVQNEARDEINSMTNAETGLTYETIDRLQYCDAVIKETLRLLPPVPMTLRMAAKDDTLPGGYFIRAGTVVNMSLGPMMRRPEVYDDPENFIPERFMKKDAAEGSVYRFAPFIYGSHQCLGYRFALVEMKAILAVLLPRFRFHLDPAVPAYKRAMTITMRPKPALKLLVSHVN